MDQLSAHTSEKAKRHMKELGFRYVYSAAYCPQYNPIELMFSKVKQRHMWHKVLARKVVDTQTGEVLAVENIVYTLVAMRFEQDLAAHGLAEAHLIRI